MPNEKPAKRQCGRNLLQSPPSTRLSRYLLLDDWSDFSQSWYNIAFLLPEGVQVIFGPIPRALGRGSNI